MSDLEQRVEALERALKAAWVDDDQCHPQVLHKRVQALEGKVLQLAQMVADLYREAEALRVSLQSWKSDNQK